VPECELWSWLRCQRFRRGCVLQYRAPGFRVHRRQYRQFGFAAIEMAQVSEPVRGVVTSPRRGIRVL
jgi:hypothetical protein